MRYKKFIHFVLILTALYPLSVFAYDDKTTHPGLTQEVVNLYNRYKEPKLSNEQKEYVIQGSINEDNPPTRSLNHFYDPIRNMGVFDYRNAIDWALGRDAENNDYSWPKIIKYYAEGNESEAFHGLGHIVHLIEDMAVPEHTRNDPHMGDNFTNTSSYEDWTSQNKNRNTLSGLSSNLKINNFTSVEEIFLFLSSYTNANYFSQDSIKNNIYQYQNPVILYTVNNYGYGQDSLFSDRHKLVISYEDKNGKTFLKMRDDEDTSVLSEYFDRLGPLAISAGASVVGLFMKEAIVAREKYLAEQKIKQEEEIQKINELADKLSQKGTVWMIFYGMGSGIGDVVQSLASKIGSTFSSFAIGVKGLTEDAVVLARTGSFTGSLAASVLANEASSIFSKVSESISNIDKASAGAFIITPKFQKDIETKQSPNEPLPNDINNIQVTFISVQNNNNDNKKTENQNNQSASVNNSIPTGISPLKDYKPGFGGGGGGNGSGNEQINPTQSIPPQTQTEETPPPQQEVSSSTPDQASQIAPPIVVSPENNFSLNLNQVSFIGSSTKSAIISAELTDGDVLATTTADSDGSWQFVINLSNGQYQLNFFSIDPASSTNRSLPTTLAFIVDAVLPEATLTIAECEQSISRDTCLVLSKTLNIIWSSDSPNLDYFSINNNGVLSTTTATSTSVNVPNDSFYNFSVVAVDKNGSQSSPVSKTVEINQMPIVISEIDWDGTPNSASDEWVEIYNRTNGTINLDNFVLRAEDASPYINLAGYISPKSYFLIERKNSKEVDEATESPIQTEVADMWVSFGNGLKNDGEHLLIDYKKGDSATTTVFDVPFCNEWCGQGSGSNRVFSLEWVNFINEDMPFGYWRTALPIGKSKDRAGNILTASPKAKNSTDYLINFGSNEIDKDLVLTKENGPYLTTPEFPTTVSKGVTLTIEPGVIIKSFNRGSFNVFGHLIINGTADSPVVFTSLYDDEYGGDFNNDENTHLSSAGDWQGVRIFGEEATSTINYGIFRYGGLKYPDSLYPAANLYTEEAPITVSNSIFEYGYTQGVSISNVSTSATLINNVFKNTTKEADAYGLAVSATNAVIEGNRISGNGRGLVVSAINGGSIKNNIIENNTGVAVYMGYLMAGFNIEGNSGSGNGVDSIQMIGDLSAPGVATILGKNSLPYQNMGLNVPASSTVTFASGAVMKSGSEVAFTINGNLEVLGASQTPVVFTSIEDDSDGVDVTHNGEVTPSAGSTSTIKFSNAVSKIENAVFRYFSKALEYINSPIDLENVVFENNSVALVADPLEKIIRANNVSFVGPGAGSTIPLNP